MTELDLIHELNSILNRTNNRYDLEMDWLDVRKAHWEKDRIRIGVVGVTSSGKSTLINAILGNKLLTEAVRPSSSQLVSCSYSEKPKMTVFFNDGKTRKLYGKELTQDSVRKYSDEKYNVKNKKNVQQVEVSTPDFTLGKDVLLIDSPGLDAYNMEHHEKLTLETLIPTVDLCVFVTTFKTNSDLKMKAFLNTIAKYKCPVIIVQNMYDALKPSIDGKKDIDQVALEHKKRVERIIATSEVTEDNLYEIVQISAIEAMKGRCLGKNCDMEQFNVFNDTVKKIIAEQKPRIAGQRIKNISDKIHRLITEEKKNLNQFRNQDVPRFVFDDVESKFYSIYDNSCYKISNEFHKLDSAKLLKRATKTETYNKDTIEYINKQINNIELIITNEIIKVNTELYSIVDKLNLSRRDIISFNGLPSVPEVSVKVKHETIRAGRRKEKSVSGFFKRGWGFLTGDSDAGYEFDYESREVIDEEGTKEACEKYIERVLSQYKKSFKSWDKSLQATFINVERSIENERVSYNQRLQEVADAKELKVIIKELESILKKYRRYVKKPAKKKREKGTTKKSKLIKLEVGQTVYGVHILAKQFIYQVNALTMDQLLKMVNGEKKKNVIVTWDDYAYEFFKFHHFEPTGRAHDFVKIDSNKVVELPLSETGRNVFVMFNTIQIASAKNQILESGILQDLNENDVIIFVIQDFEELINGDGVSDGLKEMQLLKQEFQISHSCGFMINHENPLYNMAYVQNQIWPCKNITEENMFLKDVGKKMMMFVTPQSIEVVGDIIRGD